MLLIQSGEFVMTAEFLGAAFVNEVSGRSLAGVLGVLVGTMSTWAWARWKRHVDRRSILAGDARDTVVIAQHIVESRTVPAGDGPGTRRVATRLRIRSLGQESLSLVVPNGHLANVFADRAVRVTPAHALISMEGVEGSYLLETLTNFVCDRVGNEPFEHDLYIMTPCCEPAELAQHQPITILLIALEDLKLFENFETCRDAEVEHSSDGARVLTLMAMAQRFREEQAELQRLRALGESTQFVETMYILDLALDRRSAPIVTKRAPWERYQALLPKLSRPMPAGSGIPSTLPTCQTVCR